MPAAISAQVQIDFGANAAGRFILDSSLLDGSDTLAFSNWVDVTSSVSGQITVTRGRNREVDQFQAGTCSFQLRNEGRTFDPSSTTTTPLTLRAEVIVSVTYDGTAYPIFDGYIEDFDVTYEQPNVSVINVTCVDAFSILSNVKLRNFAQAAGLTTGQAFVAAMQACGITLPYYASPASSKVQAATQNDVTLLDYIQTLARTEQGSVFCDEYGTIVFSGRARGTLPSGLTFTDDQAAIAADTTGTTLGYSTVSQRSASLLLFNSVTAQRSGTGTTPQTATDSGSATTYLPRALELTNLECASDADALSLATYLLGRYAQPELRFDAITVELAGLSNAQASSLLRFFYIGFSVPVTRTPGVGSAVTRTCIFEGVSFNLDATSGSCRATYNLGSTDPRTFFILDDATNGVLNTSVLNF